MINAIKSPKLLYVITDDYSQEYVDRKEKQL